MTSSISPLAEKMRASPFTGLIFSALNLMALVLNTMPPMLAGPTSAASISRMNRGASTHSPLPTREPNCCTSAAGSMVMPRSRTSPSRMMVARSPTSRYPRPQRPTAEIISIKVLFSSRERATCPFSLASRSRLGVGFSVRSSEFPPDMPISPLHAQQAPDDAQGIRQYPGEMIRE